MKKVIVTTTINPITEAIRRFQKMNDWELIVVGDKKTPDDYRLEHGIYITPKMQDQYDHDLSESIGWNCIQRRNFGLLWAWDADAEIIALVDDDNIPNVKWGKELFLNISVETNFFETDLPVFDPVGATNEKHLWHRGYPLPLLSKRNYSKISRKTIKADIQADFWDGDPDIDAICRMEHAPVCKFLPEFFPIASNRFSPFNSQNTFLRREVLPYYFLFPHVGRMDDIWASYYVQAHGFKVIYGAASVFQERNVHDYIIDMKSEYLGYEQNLNIVKDLLESPNRMEKYLPNRSKAAFDLYRRHFKNGI